MHLTLILSSLLCVVPAANATGWEPHIEAEVLLHPSTGVISWRVSLSRVGLLQTHFDFPLHSGLTPQLESAGTLTQIRHGAAAGTGAALDPQRPVPRRWWRVEFEEENRDTFPVILSASGVIQEELTQIGSGAGRSFSSTPGTIEEKGVFLGGATSWLPQPERTRVSFSLQVDLPAGWTAVSQGTREAVPSESGRSIVRWISESEKPQEEIFLIAARFHEYRKVTSQVEAQVFLRDDEPNLAAKYLEATVQYVEMYSKLIGPYPYSKFALIENFWESGYGMPSFTLLGPQVIRLPFIIRSSYPHEVLHNWWGNSVYVDYSTGNWCEGLTAYLADHLMKEGEGRGAEYRRDALKKFGSYVQEGLDFPLRDFRSRHSGATEAVGYGKCLMLWHMIRLKVGDEAFKRGLQEFNSSFSFRSASFTDIANSIGAAAGTELADWMMSWIETTGAPEFRLTVDSAEELSRIGIEQVQELDPYRVQVPVFYLLKNSSEWLHEMVDFSTDEAGEIPRKQLFEVTGSLAAVRVDPFFDVFRRLDRSETPPTIGDIFGASSQLIILPSMSPRLDAWRALADSWATDGDVRIVLDTDLKEIPQDRAVWILGEPTLGVANERLRGTILSKGANSRNFERVQSAWKLPTTDPADEGPLLSPTAYSGIQVERHPDDGNLTIGLIRCLREAAIPGLARKLPHYGKYSYLLFEGDEPTNTAKGEWAAGTSPLSWTAKGVSIEEIEDTREPLARPGPVLDGDRMISDVYWLADPQLEGRENGSVGLEQATQWVADRFEEIGLQPGAPDGSFFDSWSEEELRHRTRKEPTLRNVIGVIAGTDEALTGQSVVVLAHVDHLGRGWPDVRSGNEGKIHPGADDNASGVAVMLETARIIAGTHRPARTIVFVATSAEEWGLRGARRYIESMRQWPAQRAISVISIDAVGRLSEGRLLALGTGTATEWIHIARGIGFTTGVAATAVKDDPGGSDQVPFHALGVPGIQLTTGAHDDYHRPGDTADKVDAAGMVQVATWLREALLYLSDRTEPLTSTLDGAAGTTTAPAAGRRVFLGTIPDFADTGPGVRIEGVVKDSPAQAAGLREGDRLLSLDGTAIDDLRGYSNLLKQLEAGDTVLLVIERKADVFEVNVVLRKR
ncbi:MAG: M20/M25/M40 family metallo-hydrolase [Planctomycetota bacterium]|nr:M20/M25/M40 family metallo-hydrolase [Planctomycetota bacterium]